MNIALKVDVDTLRGSLQGVPSLVRLFAELRVDATFLFSLGPDNTGRALRRLFRPGFLSKVLRTSVAANYGLRTLTYGVLRPGPDIGLRARAAMREAQQQGFETGIHTWDHVRWQDFVARRGAAWTLHELSQAAERYEQVFGSPAHTFGAAGWQINQHALAWQVESGMQYCSDTRGASPFFPVMNGKRYACPQLPTTLPTLDELVGREGITLENVVEHLVALAAHPAPHGHVFTLHAELEGMAYLALFRRLVLAWRAEGHELVSLRQYARALDRASLPNHDVIAGMVPGRAGTLALQGPRVATKSTLPL